MAMQATRRSFSQLSALLLRRRRLASLMPAACQQLAINQGRHRCTTVDQAISPPLAEGQDRDYAPNIRKIVEEISHLTLIEVADLNELLKRTLNIQDAPMMAMGAMPAAQAPGEEEDEAPVQEKSLFTVKLTAFSPDKKVPIIKEIKALVQGMNLVQAKKFVESLPQPVKTELPKEEAEKLKAALEAVGGTVELA